MKQRLNKQEWQALLSEQEQSGLSVAAFCREKNLTARTSTINAVTSIARLRNNTGQALFEEDANSFSQ